MKKSLFNQTQIQEVANKSNTSQFIQFLEDNKVNYSILDQDNIFDDNDGLVNIEVDGMDEGVSLLFADGRYQE